MRLPQACKTIALTLALVLSAQSVAPAFARAGQQPAAGSNVVTVPDGTELTVVTTEEISSKTATENDPVTFDVAEDVVVNGHTVIAKGTKVKGFISDAEKSGRMGKSGKLNVRIESTTAVDGQKIKLRASKSGKGGDKTGSVIALSLIVSPLFLLKKGKDAKIKSGTQIKVFTDEEKQIAAK